MLTTEIQTSAIGAGISVVQSAPGTDWVECLYCRQLIQEVSMRSHVCLAARGPQGSASQMSGLEQDPYGKDLREPGAKADANKAEYLDALQAFPLALAEVNKVVQYGAKKYSPRGFLEVPDGVARYTNALLRHLVKEVDSATDEASQLSHFSQVAWNALARAELLLRSKVCQ